MNLRNFKCFNNVYILMECVCLWEKIVRFFRQSLIMLLPYLYCTEPAFSLLRTSIIKLHPFIIFNDTQVKFFRTFIVCGHSSLDIFNFLRSLTSDYLLFTNFRLHILIFLFNLILKLFLVKQFLSPGCVLIYSIVSIILEFSKIIELKSN